MAKNTARVFAAFALANLYLVWYRLGAERGDVSLVTTGAPWPTRALRWQRLGSISEACEWISVPNLPSSVRSDQPDVGT